MTIAKPYERRLAVAQTALLLVGIGLTTTAGVRPARAQSGTSPATTQAQQPARSQDSNIPDAPSTVQPPPPPAPAAEDKPVPQPPGAESNADTSSANTSGAAEKNGGQTGDGGQPPPPMPPVQTLPAGSTPRNQINPKDDLYKISVPVNFVQVPVTVKDRDGRLVDGLTSKDFSVLENGKKQQMTFFTADPFALAVAVVIDLGMPDVAVQKVNQTFPALVGAFSLYDEVAIYTYSSTVSEVSDYNAANQRLAAVLNQMKLERGHNNGVPVLSGPLASGPTVNGVPVGGAPVNPVSSPPKEAHVLNDAILRAALDLSKRDRTRRKVIFVISDGREMGSTASYGDVKKVLQTQGVQVWAVALEASALPIYSKLERLHLPREGYGNLLPKYASATGGDVYTKLSRNDIEDAYARITSEARNQYTLGYTTRATASTAFRDIEVKVDHPGLSVTAKEGYYPVPQAR